MSTQKFHEVTTNSNIVSASPFHVVVYKEFIVDSGPDSKEIYKQGGRFIDGQWENFYALTELGLSKLANEAGIHGTPERIDDRTIPYVCAYRFNGEWVQPDSTVLAFSTDYELDLRDYITINGANVKGARFEQAQQAELELLIEQHFKNELKGANGKFLAGESKRNKLALLRKNLTGEELKAFEDRAEEKALKFIVQTRIHIVSRAQTGAKERFIRKVLGLKNAYTIAELKNPFRIPRSEFRFDKMVEQLGPELAKPLLELKAASLLNIAPGALAQYKQLVAPQTIHPAHMPASASIEAQPTETAGPVGIRTADVIDSTVTVTSAVGIGQVFADATMPAPMLSAIASPVSTQQSIGAEIINVDLGDGKQKAMPRREIIGVKVANSAWFKKQFLNHKHFLDKGGNPVRKHFDNHLRAHFFGISSPVNLTWEMLVAMQQHLDGKGDDPKYYPPVPQPASKKEKEMEKESGMKGGMGTDKSLTLAERVANAGLSILVAQWRQSYHLPSDVEEANQDFDDMLSVILEGVEKGHFGTDTAEGITEIDKEFRASFTLETPL